MPYRVVLINDNESIIVHSPINPDIKFLSGIIHQSAENIDSFDFSFNQSNPADAFIKERLTEIEVVDVVTGEVEFEGPIRNRTGQTRMNGETIKRFSADDALIYLEDSTQYAFNFEGKPSDFFKKLMEHHNEHVDPHQQFAVGLCEVDSYKVYVEDGDDPELNVVLSVGDNATIKSTTKYIWNNDGIRLTIASSVLGVTHTVETVGVGTFAGKYLLRHPNSAWGISGWIQAEDIVETYTTSGPTSSNSNTSPSTSIYAPGTKVMIKSSATTYYKSADGTGPTPVKDFVRERVHTTLEYNRHYKRYAIYYNGELVAWVNASDLVGGAITLPTEPTEVTGQYVTRTRKITADISYTHSTLDAIKEYLLRPYGAEIYWEKVEGVRTLNIVNRRINETDHRIAIGLNLVSMQENFDPSGIITRLVPIGKLRSGEEA